MNSYFIDNVQLVLPEGIHSGAVFVSAGKIKSIVLSGVDSTDVDKDSIKIDGQGQYLSPGFIDIHIHGGGGSDFTDNSVEAFLNIAETHARFGTTSMLPTTLTTTHQHLLETLACYDRANQVNVSGAQFIGVHLEGPYFSVQQKGAQDERYIRNPVVEEYKEMVEKFPFVRRWSIAPELPGALEMGQYLVNNQIIAAAAHTDATYDEIVQAHQVGYSLMTHFYSAMSSIKRVDGLRVAGAVEAGYLIDDMDVEIIADGVHLPKPILQLIFKIKPLDKIILITDAIRAAGTKDTKSVVGPIGSGQTITIKDGIAKLAGQPTLAGSVATADRLIRVIRDSVDLPLYKIIKLMSHNPARVFGLEQQKGSIQAGFDADLILFDDDISVSWTMVQGRIVYDANGASAPTG